MEIVNENFKNQPRHTNIAKRLAFGIILIIVGVVFLLKNSGVLSEETANVIISWPMLLIAIGVVGLFGSGKLGNIVLIVIGGYFLALNHLNVSENFSHMFWPVLLIVMGVILVFKARFFSQSHRISKSGVSTDYIDEVAIFGGNNRIITSNNFKGGKITSIFGGSKIDLSNCKLADGINELEVSSIFGGTSLKVPSDWNIQLQVASIFGGFEDKRYPSVTDTSKTLIIKGAAIFGGGDIKNGRNIY